MQTPGGYGLAMGIGSNAGSLVGVLNTALAKGKKPAAGPTAAQAARRAAAAQQRQQNIAARQQRQSARQTAAATAKANRQAAAAARRQGNGGSAATAIGATIPAQDSSAPALDSGASSADYSSVATQPGADMSNNQNGLTAQAGSANTYIIYGAVALAALFLFMHYRK